VVPKSKTIKTKDSKEQIDNFKLKNLNFIPMNLKTVFFMSFFITLLSCNLIQKKNEAADTGDKEEIHIVREYHDNGRIKSETEARGRLRHGITKTYSNTGILLSEINYVNNKKDGPSINYYTSGKVHTKLMYKNGVKEGESVWYYESGKVFRINPFKNGKLNGIQKFYFENGKIMAEVPYSNGQPGTGLKEYTESGELLKKYPSIRFEEVNQVFEHQNIILKISLSNQSSKVKFYFDNLIDGKYLDEKSIPVSVRSGIARKEFKILPGSEIKESINVIAVYKTKYGLPYVTQRTYRLSGRN
jgi:antitoxin component YwqK of YwqJK toxin-antitoxin module